MNKLDILLLILIKCIADIEYAKTCCDITVDATHLNNTESNCELM